MRIWIISLISIATLAAGMPAVAVGKRTAVPSPSAVANSLKQRNQKTEIINLPQKNASVKMKVGQTFTYTAQVHASVGIAFRAEYDKSAFKVSSGICYDNPEAVESGMCGADSAMETYTFKALKKGNYTIRIIHEFRGDTEKTFVYKIKVE